MSAVEGEGLVLDVVTSGEKGRLTTLFSAEQGRIRGIVKGLRAKPFQPLDEIKYSQFKRLESQLGTLDIEVNRSRAGWWLGERRQLLTVNWLCELLLALLPDGQAYPALWLAVQRFLNDPDMTTLWRRAAELELFLLHAFGYGIPLCDEPVVPDGGWQKELDPLAFVSPKSGRAVCRSLGLAYADRLLILPGMWGGEAAEAWEDCRHAFRLTGMFMEQALHGNRLKDRTVLLDVLLKELHDR